MESGSSGHSEMRATNLRFMAQCRGNRFEVEIRALKGYYCLVVCPYALVKGDRLVLSPVDAGATPAFARLQLFARVLVPHASRGMYETVCEKLVSPPGLTVLMEYLQSNLGVCIASSHIHDASLSDQDLVYFDFASATVNFPSRGQAPSHRLDAVRIAQPEVLPSSGLPATPPTQRDPLFASGQRRGPIPTPSNPIRSGSFAPQTGSGRDGRGLAEGGTRGHDVQARSLYGMELTSDEFDVAEALTQRQQSANQAAAVPRPEPAIPVSEESGKSGLRGTVTMLIRSLANSMSDSDPFSEGGKK